MAVDRNGRRAMLVVRVVMVVDVVVWVLEWSAVVVGEGRRAGGVMLITPSPLRHPPSPVLATIPPVLDSIVAASVEASSNLSPLLTHLPDQALNQLAFFGSDGVMVKGGLEVLVKSFAALFWCSCTEHLRDADPVVGALLLDNLQKVLVLCGGPRPTTSCGGHLDR